MFVMQRRTQTIHIGRRIGNFFRRWLSKFGLVALGVVIGAGLMYLKTGA